MLGALALGIAGELRRKGRIVPIVPAMGGALLLALFARTSSVPAAALLLILMGAVDTMMYALANTYVQECASDAERGRANAIFSLAFRRSDPNRQRRSGKSCRTIRDRGGALEAGAASACAGALAFWFAAPRAREAA